jgi:glyoxylase-like metal-dependent hydrolase (beta-lactamase superfamily II)
VIDQDPIKMSVRAVSKHVHLIDAPYKGESGVLGTYIVKGEFFMVVDPGPTVSASFIIKALEENGVSLELLRYVAPTHIHLDHAAGSWKLLERYKKAELLVHPRGARHMNDPSKLEARARQLLATRSPAMVR